MWPVAPERSTDFIREAIPKPEQSLVDYWMNLPSGTLLYTTEGDPVMVLYPGRRNRNEGPDILDAHLYIGGDMYQGAVECHLRARDWYTHGHDRDPRYDQVILHVVSRLTNRFPDLPTVIIYPRTVSRGCPVSSESPVWERTLRRMGAKRWMTFLTTFLETPDPDMLWRRCLRILGQGGNEDLFQQLGERLSWTTVLAWGSAEAVAAQVEKMGLRWHHRSIRPAAWPERRYPHLFFLARTIAWLSQEESPPSIPELRRQCSLPQASNLSIELMGNCWLPWVAAQALATTDWDRYDQAKQAWEALIVSSTYGCLRRRWGEDGRLRIFPVLQGGLSLVRHYCSQKSCDSCPLNLYAHDSLG